MEIFKNHKTRYTLCLPFIFWSASFSAYLSFNHFNVPEFGSLCSDVNVVRGVAVADVMLLRAWSAYNKLSYMPATNLIDNITWATYWHFDSPITWSLINYPMIFCFQCSKLVTCAKLAVGSSIGFHGVRKAFRIFFFCKLYAFSECAVRTLILRHTSFPLLKAISHSYLLATPKKFIWTLKRYAMDELIMKF